MRFLSNNFKSYGIFIVVNKKNSSPLFIGKLENGYIFLSKPQNIIEIGRASCRERVYVLV
nr:hypothetical protein [uncultured Cetobacterium sp.]